MLASPPASAVNLVGDTGYGNLKGAALAGWSDTLGISAVQLASGKRLVLSQAPASTPGGTPGAISLTQFKADGTLDSWGTGNSGRVDLTNNGTTTAGVTVSELLVNTTDNSIWVVGKKASDIVIWHLDATGTAISGGSTLTGNVVTTGIAAGYASGFFIVDAALDSTGKLAVAVQASSTTLSPTNYARIYKVTVAGALDTANFNTTSGYVDVPAASGRKVLSLGGIGYGASDVLFGTAQVSGATASDDTESSVYRIAAAGTADMTFGNTTNGTAATGESIAIEAYAEAQSPKWQNESLADVIAVDSNANLLVSGKAAGGYFLAKINTASGQGDLQTAFGNDGVTSIAASPAGAGDPEIAVGGSPTRYWLANDAADGTAEVFRWTLSGGMDPAFGSNGYQRLQSGDFGHLGSVTAEPITFSTTSTTTAPIGTPIVGAGTNRQVTGGYRYDAAGWKLVAPSAPPVVTAPTISSDNTATPIASTGVDVGDTQVFAVTFTSNVTPTIEWQWAAPGSTNWQPVQNGGIYNIATTNTPPSTSYATTLKVFTSSTAQNGTQFRAVATNSAGTKVSAVGTLPIKGYPVITTQPAGDSVFVGATNVKFSAGFTVPGGSAVTSARWQVLKVGHNDWEDASGTNYVTSSPVATSPSVLTVAKVDSSLNGAKFRAIIGTATGSVASNVATLQITGAPVISHQPENTSVEEGKEATFWVQASGSSALTYQWQWSKTGADDSFAAVPGGTSPTLKWPNAKLSDSGTYFQVKVTDANGNFEYSMKAKLTVTPKGATHAPAWGDYDGDGKTDIASFKDGSFYWNGAAKPEAFGAAGDKLIVGNFDSDKAADKAVVRGNTWKTDGNPDVSFGKATDWPVSGDFDGDGMTDVAVWRPSNGTWYVKDGATVVYGKSGDIPVPADYDGDGSDEIAVFRPSTGAWYILGAKAVTWGKAGDIPVRGDWNGDGSSDVAVYRPSNSTWYPWGAKSVGFGRVGDVPLAGDFDGDGSSDIAVYRPSNTTWYFANMDSVKFGGSGWWPVTGVK
ncbi:immunoglobulin domain-containing protein [Cryptosporangium japonicum]|uniref:Ig-like domain-containing protein n=1 Tax=Cryptosporangium japonicum TaxID=80872 RepID=A0ABN0UQQ5_9ACTN